MCVCVVQKNIEILQTENYLLIEMMKMDVVHKISTRKKKVKKNCKAKMGEEKKHIKLNREM